MRKDDGSSWISSVYLLTHWLLGIFISHYMKNSSYYILENKLYIELTDLLLHYIFYEINANFLDTVFLIEFIIQNC